MLLQPSTQRRPRDGICRVPTYFSFVLVLLFVPSWCVHTASGQSSSGGGGGGGGGGGSLLVHKYSTRVVRTKYGPLRGVILQQLQNHQPVEAFLGVPYATPPLGSLRYMPPVTPSMWRSTRLADAFSPVCPQRAPEIGNRTEALLELPRGRLLYLEKLLPLLANQSEDCLYLNIYVPRGDLCAEPSLCGRLRYHVTHKDCNRGELAFHLQFAILRRERHHVISPRERSTSCHTK